MQSDLHWLVSTCSWLGQCLPWSRDVGRNYLCAKFFLGFGTPPSSSQPPRRIAKMGYKNSVIYVELDRLEYFRV